MHVILSIYGNSKLILRKVIDTLKPNSHKFYSIDEELEKLNISDLADFCVLHRVPVNLMLSNEIPELVEVEESPDFDMYRMVVQYTSAELNKGSVIYETPPNLNQNKNRGNFLSFSNKICLTDNVKNNLVFINHSTNRDFDSTANVKLSIYNSHGLTLTTESFEVKPFSFTAFNVNALKLKTKEQFLTFTAAADGLSLIPLSVSLCNSNGGVSIEHSHPPQAYIMAPWLVTANIKKAAVKILS